MLIKQLFYPVLFFLVQGLNAITISLDRVTRGTINLSIGDITINSGAYWSIIDNAVSAFVGDLTVQSDAGFYISSTNPLLGLQVTLLGVLNSISNDGIIAFNSLKTLIAPNYNLIGLSFHNTGEIYFAADGTNPPVFGLTAANWDNSGLIVFYQNHRSEALINLGTPLLSITNDGSVCLYSSVYQQLTKIDGSGWYV
ncbi:hypothetical protein LELG_02559 [Lodderomyces elongisporus NRRL YB-4239]|uniref:Hyphally-regulated cell wall protein N-terminal domain-containing protein n=1 Tax=Lodderomyces elongisporus (strain ATCC 11503 / CBS 2605 / JCM 1781 / NBRC 1676 / NRRL YB-4239) TaxID=379508 RepID=A5DYX2_LODEL|nr:hypothetical protein LELG_02559 [Lodderomyces elongisporus NRRL YB-4239]